MPGILTLDKRTTRARAIFGDHIGTIRAVAQKPLRCAALEQSGGAHEVAGV